VVVLNTAFLALNSVPLVFHAVCPLTQILGLGDRYF